MFLVANGIATVLNTELPQHFRASAMSTPGTPVILRLLNRGEIEFGLGMAGTAYEAFRGIGHFTPATAKKNFRSVTYLYPNVVQLIASKELRANSFADIVGRRFTVGATGSASELVTREIARVYGMDYTVRREFVPEFASEASAVELIQNRQADGGQFLGAVGSASMRTLTATGRFDILNISDEKARALHNLNPAYYRFTIPANTYAHQPEPIQTVAQAMWLYARADVPDEIVYLVVRAIYEHQPSLQAIHIAAADIKKENALRGKTVPLHPGAERFFREIGVIR
jgi:TRAP transporter TAXI family solute receptor